MKGAIGVFRPCQAGISSLFLTNGGLQISLSDTA